MHQEPVSPDPGPSCPDWMDDPAYLAMRAEDEDPGDLDLDEDPGDAPPPEVDHEELVAGAAAISAEQARVAAVMAGLGLTAAMAAAAAIGAGRRGPGMPGSAESFPGVYASRASGFASGKPLDAAPGCVTLARFAEEAAGEDDRYPGASDDELLGVIAAWDRVEAHACARKHAAVAELIRRRPERGCALEGPAQMPGAFDEFTARELGAALGETRGVAEDMLSLGYELAVSLPGTRAAFRSGILGRRKAAVIAAATRLLDPREARAAEAMVLDRAGALTPPALRAAITRAVMDVAPDKAAKRREHEAEKTRVERWAEASGNAGLAGRELPVAEVLAADQRVTAWAKELRKAGLEGGMDALRARAYLDILLGMDSRPLGSRPESTREPPAPAPAPAPGGPLAGRIPPGFAGHVTLTIPEATVTGRADRPGELGGIGPIDLDLARDLAAAAARNPRSTWCVTSPTARATPSATAAPDRSDDGNRTGPIRPAGHRSPSPPPISPARPAGTAPGGSPPADRTCSSRSDRSRPGTAITGGRPGAMIPESCSGTWPRSGTPPARDPAAGGPLETAISSTTSPTKPAAERACATGTRRASDNHTDCPLGSGSGARSCTTRTTTAGSLIALISHRGMRSGRRPAGDPALEDGDVLRRPCPVAGHRAVAEAVEDRVLVRLDVAGGPQVEAFEHRVAVLFAEHGTDVTLEAQPCG